MEEENEVRISLDRYLDLRCKAEQFDCIINHSIYPDGTDVTFTQLADKIIISSNKELVKNDDGTYSFKN